MSDTNSVERAFAILETFERERRPLSLKDLSEFCAIPVSTCHSLVHTLLKRAYLYQTGRRKDLYPTRRIHDMGATILAHDPVLQRLLPMMEDLRDETRETVILGKRRQDHVVYLDVLEGPEVIRYSARPGDEKPLHSSSIGKCMLACLKPDEARQLLGAQKLPRVTASTITRFDALMADLAAGREQGVFVTRGENVADVTALAVPVSVNNEWLGLAVAGPSHRIDARFADVARALKAAQERLLQQGITGHG
jgi:IclR family transcriptional regulator, acetate operon repressor